MTKRRECRADEADARPTSIASTETAVRASKYSQLQHEAHGGDEGAGEAVAAGGALDVGGRVEEHLGLVGESLELVAEQVERGVVEAQHVDRRHDLALVDP